MSPTLGSTGESWHHRTVSVPRIPWVSVIVCFSCQTVSQHRRLVLSQYGCKVPVLMLLTSGFAQCLPCICVANISQNSCSDLYVFTNPPRARCVSLSSQPICSSSTSPCLGPSCLRFSSGFLCHQLIPEDKNLAQGTLLQSAGVVWSPLELPRQTIKHNNEVV